MQEAEKLEKLISKHKESKGKDLLEIACGTGHHLKCFQSRFNCSGLDLNREMLKIAGKNVQGARLHHGNMINFKISKKFDIITCLFSSIGYVKTYSNLKRTINNFSSHLKKGGVLLIEPWFTKSSFRAGIPHIFTYSKKNIKIARLSISKVRNNISVVEMHHIIAERSNGIRHYVDFHELGLFGINETLRIMKGSGLKPIFLKDGLMKGRGLYVGVKE